MSNEAFGITINATEVKRWLGSVAGQAPYALSVAINNTMKDVQRAEINDMSNRFTIRRPGFLRRSVKISQFAKKDDLTGVIGIEDIGGKPTSDIFGKFEEASTKTGRGKVAVPTEYIRPTKNAVITKGKRPRNLKRTWKGKTKAGNEAIFVKKGRGKNQEVHVAYILETSVHLPKLLSFYSVAAEITEKVVLNHLSDALDRAIRTAK